MISTIQLILCVCLLFLTIFYGISEDIKHRRRRKERKIKQEQQDETKWVKEIIRDTYCNKLFKEERYLNSQGYTTD